MKQLVKSNIDPNWPNILVEYSKPIEIFVDSLQGFNSNSESFKILWVKEAEEISRFKQIAIDNHKNFDAVLAYDEDVLQKCPNAHFMAFGTTWVHGFNLDKPKKFQVSHLTGFKDLTEGHLLRKKVHYKQQNITIPKDFYISQHGGVENAFDNKHLGDSKNPLFESQFHICIENSKQKNFFTEKLIDCFITKTVPIYYGCENIEEYFDTEGMLFIKDFKDTIKVCNDLNEETYQKMLPHIEVNYRKAFEYSNLLDNLTKTLNRILNPPFFSIVIPAYESKGRGVEFLNELLESINSQTFQNFEIIISDHSSDSEIEIAASKWNAKLPIRHFYCKNVRGNSSVNMNEGIKKASGKFIKIMHIDDKFCSNVALENIVSGLRNNSDASWGAVGFNHLFEQSNTIGNVIIPKAYPMCGVEALQGCPSISFFRNDKQTFFDENLIIINDYDIHYRLQKKYGKPLIIPDILITIRMHTGQVSSWIAVEKENKEKEYLQNKTKL
jgi:hypothetical protein